jgi:outer membrane immunogenic protein
MRKSIIALAALALTSTTALAADYAEPVPEAFSWTGFYIGAYGAYNDVHRDSSYGFVGGDVFPFEDFESDFDGFSGGAILGFNYQFDSIVVGIEGDVGFASIEDNDGNAGDGLGGGFGSIKEEIDMTYGVRARLGYAMDRTLLFIQGGVTWAEYEAELDGIAIPPGFEDYSDETLFGWQIGGGVEHAVTDMITVRLDYLYTDYESGDAETLLLPEPAFDHDYDLDSHTLRIGVNFLFNAF